MVWADGVQRFVARDAFSEDFATEDLRILRGDSQQLCYRIGLRPVLPDHNVG